MQHLFPLNVTLEHQHLRPKQMAATAHQTALFFKVAIFFFLKYLVNKLFKVQVTLCFHIV